LKTNLPYSLAYNILVRTFWLRKTKLTYTIWRFFWDLCDNQKIFITTKIHGFKAILPAGHWYLLVLQKYLKFNQPIVSLIKYLEFLHKRPLKIVDVGSAVGDTVLLIENRSSYKHNFICIDGDPDYIKISENNLSFLKERIKLIESLLSADFGLIGKIIKDNPTTGTSKSEELVPSSTLDFLLNSEKKIDFVKIDIDGFDGQAIGGFKNILTTQDPIIIFELNIHLYHLTNNNILKPFTDLIECGYKHFYWFDNFGNFLFYQKGINENELEKMARYSTLMTKVNGYHFDIISMKNDSDFIEFIM
jgi:FkbM family methyltransferase